MASDVKLSLLGMICTLISFIATLTGRLPMASIITAVCGVVFLIASLIHRRKGRSSDAE